MQPKAEPLPLERYVRVLRERLWIIVLSMVVCFAVTAIYVSTADKVYEAEADLLVSPASRESDSLIGLPIVRESSDPTRDVETVSRLVTSTSVARRVRSDLSSDRAIGALLNSVTAEPVAQSNIVAITAEGSSAREAQELANAFGRAIVEDRTQQLHDQLDQVLARLEARRDETDDQGRAAQEALELQINELETLRGGPDPTIRLQNPAELPTTPVAPRPLFSLAASLVVGLVLGLVGAFALELLDPRVRREDQLRRVLRLPVLARVPRESGSKTPLRPERLSPATIEAYRTLRATLSATRAGKAGSCSILVTSPSASEGKTTTAINLAASLALAGQRVILVEADLRRPSIGRTLGIEPETDLMDVVLEEAKLEDALYLVEGYGPNFEVLLAKDPGEHGIPNADGLFLPTAQALIDRAKQLADYVIIDSPPLTEVIDGLALAERADEVLLVVQLGRSLQSRIVQLAELLAQHGIEPVGIAVVGVPASDTASDYYTSPAKQAGRSRALARN
ncbi:MAG TPA: AAA family ATPase [Solirubrobacteraceae bacterium]|nr:AAA family ATPase [Solirubrobacteraceae bacterium]